MDLPLIKSIQEKMDRLNAQNKAVIFVVTGPNGSGKTVFTKQLLASLPFHQSFNLGAVAKTIRYIYDDEDFTRLENFTNKKTTDFFTPIVQFSCGEYQRNGVNVIVDGVQIDTSSKKWKHLITGGVVLEVDNETRILRNKHPETHFNRKMRFEQADKIRYSSSDTFVFINNNKTKKSTFRKLLTVLSSQLDRQLLQENLPRKQAKAI